MCGIVGIFSNENPVKKEHLDAALSALFHRGPDSQNTWISSDQKIGLGAARLSIIDLKTGDQPISNENNKIHIVVNGEFYGFKQQRIALEKKNHQFRTFSDSEIALHLYEEVGTDCMTDLRGEFAFILWDETKQICFAARDRFGIKPLYYTLYNNKLYIASEIKAILAQGIPVRWDISAAIFTQRTGFAHNSRTLFKDIFKVPPGHYLLATKNQLKLVPYWDFNYLPEAAIPLHSEAEYIEQFQHLLSEAIRLRLHADVPVACYLSGGLDSSSIVGLASSQVNEPIHTFALSFENQDYDESKIAKEMAIFAGAHFHRVAISQRELAENFANTLWHTESPIVNTNAVAKYLLSRAVRAAGFKVILTGEGADEILAGYAFSKQDLILNDSTLPPSQAARLLKQLFVSNPSSIGALLADNTNPKGFDTVMRMLGSVPAWMITYAEQAAKLNSLYTETMKSLITSYDGYDLFLADFDIPKQLAGIDPVNQSLYLWSKNMLPNYMLSILGDRTEMAHSIEGRLPFLDHHVVEFMRKVPLNLKIKNMTEKYLLRQAAKPFLPAKIYQRQKYPFFATPVLLLGKGDLYDLLQTTLRGPLLTGQGVYDRNKIIALLDSIPKMNIQEKMTWDPILMQILSICLLQQQFKIRSR
ncbi:MAG: asparagine synthase (glutamine-hydrolyzing) [Gammaproteobacteria bacterium 39-13]|nr:asparagine synthase (glutamine-hydrolyzing) [Gammaproteobacteria bacterium]OJV93898.1 MAG: asparagine synthase (glutamine-hydrolyzing) [Gammaproteobacteria bacterium 39-13]